MPLRTVEDLLISLNSQSRSLSVFPRLSLPHKLVVRSYFHIIILTILSSEIEKADTTTAVSKALSAVEVQGLRAKA